VCFLPLKEYLSLIWNISSAKDFLSVDLHAALSPTNL
jgi:hypothetical protein